MLGVVSLLVTFTLSLLLLWIEDLGLMIGSRILQFGKDMPGVKELRVNVFRCLETTADDENFGGNITR